MMGMVMQETVQSHGGEGRSQIAEGWNPLCQAGGLAGDQRISNEPKEPAMINGT